MAKWSRNRPFNSQLRSHLLATIDRLHARESLYYDLMMSIIIIIVMIIRERAGVTLKRLLAERCLESASVLKRF